jgi:signal transduction histidine kinase
LQIDINPNNSLIGDEGKLKQLIAILLDNAFKYSDDKGIANIWLSSGSIVLNGFTANIRITGTGNSRTITLSNVQGAVGGSKSISITGGTASDAAGNLSNAATSAAFIIVKDNDVPQDPKPQDQTNKPADWIPNPNTGK